MDELMTERLNLLLTESEMDQLIELAGENAGGNKSLMVRKLIKLAASKPKALGLYPPKKGEALAGNMALVMG